MANKRVTGKDRSADKVIKTHMSTTGGYSPVSADDHTYQAKEVLAGHKNWAKGDKAHSSTDNKSHKAKSRKY